MMSLHIVSEKDARAIIALDAEALSSEPKRFTQANGYLGYLAINAWLNCIHQYAPLSVAHIVQRLKLTGLSKTIKSASESADAFIAVDEYGSLSPYSIKDSLWFNMFCEVTDSRWNYRSDPDKLIGKSPEATFLFLCRFMKRFTYDLADRLEQESLKRFFALNTDMRRRYRKQRIHTYFIPDLREVIECLNWDSVKDEILNCVSDPFMWSLTSGACCDCSKDQVSKVLTMYKYQPDCLHGLFAFQPYSFDGKCPDPYRVPVTPMAVPKNYKAARIIAPDSIYRNSKGKVVAKLLQRILPKEIPIQDQSQNQNLAMEASKDGSLATLDQSNASDRISKCLFMDIFPTWFVQAVSPLLPTYLVRGKETIRAEMMATAGNSLTFILESIVFWAMAKVSCAYTALLGSELNTNIVSVYGDDVILPTECATFFMELCDVLGFELNRDKSHYEPNDAYRESCGAEYANGIDLSSYYWPRANLHLSSRTSLASGQDLWADRENLTTPYQSLVSLQHRLYYVAPFAAAFLSEEILASNPKLTASREGGSVDEVWVYEATANKVSSPYARIVANQYGKRYLERLPSKQESYLEMKSVVAIRPSKVDVTKLNGSQKMLLSHYVYGKYLEEGPFYDSPFDELLGLSTSRWTLLTRGHQVKLIKRPK